MFRPVRAITAAAVLAVLASALPAAAPAVAADDDVWDISYATGGGTLPGDVIGPVSLSKDGSVAAFVTDDDYYGNEVYVNDSDTATTDRLTSKGDFAAMGASTAAAISSDGKWVAFDSDSSELTGSDGSGVARIYLRDRAGKRTLLIPSPDGSGDQQPATAPALSADGSRLAFTRHDPAGDVIVVVDLAADGSTTAVATIDLGGESGVRAVLSANGSTVAYYADDAVHVYDVASQSEVARKDVAFNGRLDFGIPALSANGKVLAYVNGVPAGTSGNAARVLLDRVFVYDRSAAHPEPQQLPVSDDAAALDQPSITADGGIVAATAWWGHDLDTGTPDFDPDGGWVVRLSTGAGAIIDTGDGGRKHTVSISPDGSTIAFTTNAKGYTQEGQVSAFGMPTPDASAPAFRSGDELSADDVTATSLTLGWPKVTGPVTGYHLTQDGKDLADTDAATTSYDVTGLTAATEYTFTVTAVGSKGAASDPLTLKVASADDVPPTFPDDAALTVNKVDCCSMRVAWPAASDNLELAGYKIAIDGADVTKAPTSALSYTAKDLDPASSHRIAVRPYDAQGNDGEALTVDVTTVSRLFPSRQTTSEIDLFWDLPAGNAAARSAVTGFVVESAPTCTDAMGSPHQVAATANTYTLAGLTSETSLCVQVFASHADGTTSPWSDAAAVSTVALPAPSITMSVPRVTGTSGELQLGGTMSLTLTGDSGHSASATLWQDQVGSGTHVDVPLAEGKAGVYAGTYVVDGSPNRFYKVMGTLSDGAHQAVAAVDSPPVWVGGDLDLTIDKLLDPVDSMTLHLEAAREWDESLDIPATDDSRTLLHLPYGTYTATLVASDGEVLATREDVVIDSGGSTALTLTPARHTTLTVNLTVPEGEPAGGYTVSASTPDGTVVDTVDMVRAPSIQLSVPMHTVLTVTARLDDPTRPLLGTLQTSVTTTADPTAAMTLAATWLPTAVATVTVTGGREPLRDATVTVTQRIDDREWSFHATTNSKGVADVPALAGPARVTATADWRLASGADGTLVTGQQNAFSFDLLPSPGLHIHPHLFTRQDGGAEVEQPLDWRTMFHFHTVLTLNDRGLSILPDVATAGGEGDVIRWCATGSEGGLTSECVTATAGKDADLDISLHLSQAGALTATLTDAAGPYTGYWTARVYPVDADGRIGAVSRDASGTGTEARVTVTDAGDGVVVITDAGGRSTGPVSFHLSDGGEVDLGTLLLSTSAPRSAASLLVSPSAALPGQLLGFRIGLPLGILRSGDQLEVTVPAQTTFEPASATVNGASVTAAKDAEHPSTRLIPLENADTTTAVIRYAVTVDRDADARALDSIVRIRHADGTVTDVGTASTPLASVTVAGPRTVAHPTFTVSGTAPAGASVVVYAGNEVAGHATAGAGGRYLATVSYADPLSGYDRPVVATTTVDGVLLRSDPLYVTYDANAVEPVSATIENGAGTAGSASRAIDFDPSAGVASFSQVYVPGTPTTVSVTFENANRITGFHAAVGSNTADGSCSGNTCAATVPTTSDTVGDVWIDYDVAPQPVASMDDVPSPTAEQLRHNLPSVFANATAKDWDPSTSTGTFTLPGLGEVQASVATEDVDSYTLTDTDKKLVAETGIHLYGLTVGMSGQTMTAEFLVPTAWLDQKGAGLTGDAGGGTAPQPLLPRMALSPGLRAFALPPITEEALKKIKFSWFMNWATAAQWTNDIGEGLYGGGRFGDLNELDYEIDHNMQCAQQIARDYAHGMVTEARGDVVMWKTVSGIVTVGGLFDLSAAEALGKTGVTKLGLDGVVGGILDNVVSWNSDASVEEAQKKVEAYIASQQCVGKKFHPLPPTPTRRKIASPTYIFDPSGFAYAGVASDRVMNVTAAILTAPSADGPWTAWDASAFGQTSPQLTDADGQYGWDVPKGFYKVRFSKDGYRTVDSEVVEVLPERMDLNVDMLATGHPGVTALAVDGSGGQVTFDQWMDVASVAAHASATVDGQPWPASVTPRDAQTAPDGALLAKAFTLSLSQPVPADAAVTVVIAAGAADYAGVALEADASGRFDATDGPTPTPTVTDTPTPSASPTVTISPSSIPSASPTPDTPSGDGDTGTLPFTGGHAPVGLAVLGMLLVVLGIIALLVRRRRGADGPA